MKPQRWGRTPPPDPGFWRAIIVGSILMAVFSAMVFAVVLLLSGHAHARHLLRKLPSAVGAKIQAECESEWNGAFGQGWCIDKAGQEWLDAHSGKPAQARPPDILVRPPDIIIRPEEGEK